MEYLGLPSVEIEDKSRFQSYQFKHRQIRDWF